jgi:hypothetical protein
MLGCVGAHATGRVHLILVFGEDLGKPIGVLHKVPDVRPCHGTADELLTVEDVLA